MIRVALPFHLNTLDGVDGEKADGVDRLTGDLAGAVLVGGLVNDDQVLAQIGIGHPCCPLLPRRLPPTAIGVCSPHSRRALPPAHPTANTLVKSPCAGLVPWRWRGHYRAAKAC